MSELDLPLSGSRPARLRSPQRRSSPANKGLLAVAPGFPIHGRCPANDKCATVPLPHRPAASSVDLLAPLVPQNVVRAPGCRRSARATAAVLLAPRSSDKTNLRGRGLGE